MRYFSSILVLGRKNRRREGFKKFCVSGLVQGIGEMQYFALNRTVIFSGWEAGCGLFI